MNYSGRKVTYSQPKMTHNYLNVTYSYSYPRVTYSDPKVTYSDPTHLPLPPPASSEPDQEIGEVKLNFWWVVAGDNQL